MIKSLIKSRKFWLTVCGVLLPILDSKLGWQIPKEALVGSIMSIVVLVGSIAYEDRGKHENGKGIDTRTFTSSDSDKNKAA